MKPLRIFISSVQKEFAEERGALKAYLLGDALLNRFFDVFLFEDLPASDRRAEPPPGTWKHWSRKGFCAWKEKGGVPSMCLPESQGKMRQMRQSEQTSQGADGLGDRAAIAPSCVTAEPSAKRDRKGTNGTSAAKPKRARNEPNGPHRRKSRGGRE